MKKDEQEWPLWTGGQKFRASLVCQWVKILLQCRVHRRYPSDILCPMDSHKESDKTDRLSMRATASLRKEPVILKTGADIKMCISVSFPSSRKSSCEQCQLDCSGTSLICVLMQATYLVMDLVLEDGQRVHQPDFGIEDTALTSGTSFCTLLCVVGCPACDVRWVLAPFFSFYTLLPHCHWYLLGSCDNQKCVQGWPVSWKLGWKWGREQWFWLWITGLE